MRLNGKTSIVTGAASGFGAGIAGKFIAEGARVLIADINLEAAEATARDLGAAASTCHVDVADAKSVAAMARTPTRTTRAPRKRSLLPSTFRMMSSSASLSYQSPRNEGGRRISCLPAVTSNQKST